MKKLLALFILLTSFVAQPSEQTDVYITKNIKASIVKNESNNYYILNNKSVKIGFFHIDSEHKTHIIHDDYNDDGYEDFSIWYMDDGMGTYKIYRIFIYQEKHNNFLEIKPSCGDEFINIISDKINKKITSTYYDENTPIKCITKIMIKEKK